MITPLPDQDPHGKGRTLAFADQLSGAALEARLGLPFETIEPIIQEFQKAQLMDTMGFASEPGLDGRPIPVRMAYTVSSAGRQRAAEMSAVQTRYFGPCLSERYVLHG